MRKTFAAIAIGFVLLGLPARADDAKPATPGADSVYGALTQVQLTEDQVQHYIDAIADMQAAMGDAPADAAEPDAKTMAKLGAIAKKHGFKDFDEYNTVAGNISLALDGIDPRTKTYVGADALIRRSIDEVKADKKMSEADKKAAFAALQNELNATTPLKYQANAALVLKHYDKLGAD